MAKRSKSVIMVGHRRRGARLLTLTRSVRRKQRQLVATGGAPRLALGRAPPLRRQVALTAQPLDFLVESFDILEMAVHRSEPHVRDFIQLAQLVMDELADGTRLL